MWDIVGIGVSTLDFIQVIDDFMPGEGVQRASEHAIQGGGPVSTALVMASRLGARTCMIDSLGDDLISNSIIDQYKKAGVCTEFINCSAGASGSFASVHVRQSDGSRAIVYSPGSATELVQIDQIKYALKSAKILHINGRHWETCKEMCHYAKKEGIKISFDGGAGRYRPELKEICDLANYNIVSKKFAEEMYPSTEIDDMLSKMIERGAEIAIITAGSDGCYAKSEGGTFHQPAISNLPVVDTTGCGDIFHGAFIYCLLNDFELRRAVKIATTAAAIKMGYLGGRGHVPSMSEIRNLGDE